MTFEKEKLKRMMMMEEVVPLQLEGLLEIGWGLKDHSRHGVRTKHI